MIVKYKAKRFGQHFLSDTRVVQEIINIVNPSVEDHFVEIGPGKGALTVMLLPLVKRLDVIEIDNDLVPILQDRCNKLHGDLRIHLQDVLRFDFSGVTGASGEKIRIIGNLPYNVSTPVIFHVLKNIKKIKDLHFMLQKEVAERLAAGPGSKTYGRLSVMVQYYCQVDLLFNVASNAFNPPPKVVSSVVRLIPRTRKMLVASPETFAAIVQAAFGMRRKTIQNSLRAFVSAERLLCLGIDSQLRAEQLQVDDFVKISNSIETQKG